MKFSLSNTSPPNLWENGQNQNLVTSIPTNARNDAMKQAINAAS